MNTVCRLCWHNKLRWFPRGCSTCLEYSNFFKVNWMGAMGHPVKGTQNCHPSWGVWQGLLPYFGDVGSPCWLGTNSSAVQMVKLETPCDQTAASPTPTMSFLTAATLVYMLMELGLPWLLAPDLSWSLVMKDWGVPTIQSITGTIQSVTGMVGYERLRGGGGGGYLHYTYPPTWCAQVSKSRHWGGIDITHTPPTTMCSMWDVKFPSGGGGV